MLRYKDAWYIKDLGYQERLELACRMVRIERAIREAARWFAEAEKAEGRPRKKWLCDPNEFYA